MARISSHGSTIRIEDYLAPSPRSGGIIALSRGKPCLMLFDGAAARPVTGDIVVPRNTGWPSLDNRPFVIADAGATQAVLADSDTTGEANPYRTPATFDIPTFVELCRSTFTLTGPAAAPVDVTTLCDDGHQLLPSIPALATWNAAGFYDAADYALRLARDAYRAGRFVIVDVRFNDGSGVAFSGAVNSLDVALGINAAVGNTLGGTVNGALCFYGQPTGPPYRSFDWPLSDADLVFDFDFYATSYWSASLGEITAAQAFIATRTSSGDLAFGGDGLLRSFAANSPRIVKGRGLWLEVPGGARLYYNDDLSNAVWVKTSMTVAQDLPSPYAGVSTLTGWSITASAADATILQTTAAISPSAGAGGTESIVACIAYLPPGATLAGAVEITQDGTTWLDIRPQLVAGGWVDVYGPIRSLSAVPFPCGIRIRTAGDRIGFMLANVDRGYMITSPILAPAGVSASRAAEQCQLNMASVPAMTNASMPRFTFLTVVEPLARPLPGILDPVRPRLGWTALEYNDDDTWTADGTGGIVNDVLTITAMTSGTWTVGHRLVSGTGVLSFTDIMSLGTGTGGTGTYNVHSSLSGTGAYPPTQTTTNPSSRMVARLKDAQGYGLNSAVKIDNGDQQIGVTFTNETVNLGPGLDPQTRTFSYNASNALGWSMDTLATPSPKANIALYGDVYTSNDAQLFASPQIGPGGYVMIGSQGGGTVPGGSLHGVVMRTLCIARAMSVAEIAAATIGLQQKYAALLGR